MVFLKFATTSYKLHLDHYNLVFKTFLFSISKNMFFDTLSENVSERKICSAKKHF